MSEETKVEKNITHIHVPDGLYMGLVSLTKEQQMLEQSKIYLISCFLAATKETGDWELSADLKFLIKKEKK